MEVVKVGNNAIVSGLPQRTRYDNVYYDKLVYGGLEKIDSDTITYKTNSGHVTKKFDSNGQEINSKEILFNKNQVEYFYCDTFSKYPTLRVFKKEKENCVEAAKFSTAGTGIPVATQVFSKKGSRSGLINCATQKIYSRYFGDNEWELSGSFTLDSKKELELWS